MLSRSWLAGFWCSFQNRLEAALMPAFYIGGITLSEKLRNILKVIWSESGTTTVREKVFLTIFPPFPMENHYHVLLFISYHYS